MRIDPEKKAAGARWLAEGKTAEWVGRWCGVSAQTVRRWRRDDPEFRAVYEAHLAGLYARGLLAVAERRENVTLRARRAATAREALQTAMAEIGRKEARRSR